MSNILDRLEKTAFQSSLMSRLEKTAEVALPGAAVDPQAQAQQQAAAAMAQQAQAAQQVTLTPDAIAAQQEAIANQQAALAQQQAVLAQQVAPQQPQAPAVMPQEVPLTGDGQGAGSVSNNPAGMDQSAGEKELLNRLEKTAAGIGGAVKKYIGDVTGSNARKANNELGKFWENDANSLLSKEEFTKAHDRVALKASKADAAHEKAVKQVKTVGGVAGTTTAVGVGAKALSSTKKDQNKEAEELLNRLEKTAFSLAPLKAVGSAILGHGQNFAGQVKNFAGNALGKDVAAHRAAITEHNLQPKSLEKALVGTELHNGLRQAQQVTNQAQKQLAVGTGIGLGGMAVGAGVANAMHPDNNQQEQVASETEEFMNGLYKEAAAQILEEVAPKVKTYTDPMSRIKFDR